MAKTKASLLSLGAHGTIGDAITYQKRGGTTIVREKPFPKQPDTLPQQYQRWLYEDYIAYWHQQTPAVKQTYQSAGVRFHLTGFQYWMKYHLSNLPDIAAWWRLDEASGATAFDSSKHENHGAIIGATPISGVINGARHFDGLNDRVLLTTYPTGTFGSMETFLRATPGQDGVIIGKSTAGAGGPYFLLIVRNNRLAVYANTFGDHVIGNTPVCDNKTHHCAILSDGTQYFLYVDGVLDTFSATPNNNGWWFDAEGGDTGSLGVLWRPAVAWWFPGDLDNLVLYNRLLATSDILRHSLRRYPS